MADVDVVVHLAAIVDVGQSVKRPRLTHSVNATGTLAVLEAARRVDAQVIVASSAAVYGDAETVPIPESTAFAPRSPYGVTKACADRFVQLYASLYDLNALALRLFNVYGPAQDGPHENGVIGSFIRQAQSAGRLTIHGDGKQTRDFVHVSDVVRAIDAAIGRDALPAAINVGTGNEITIRELARVVGDLVGREVAIRHGAPREGDIRESVADITMAREALDFEPTIDLEAGISAIFADQALPSTP